MTVRLLEDAIRPGAEIDRFTASAKGAGAVASFLGTVRDLANDHGGDAVNGLHLEHHPVLTAAGIEAAIAKANESWPLIDALVLHRIGRVGVHEPIVLVCAASLHRRAAFQATDFLMDYLKTEAFFWKKEYRASGEVWIEPRDVDYKDAERWSG